MVCGMTEPKFRDKSVCVTGAARGLGAAIARRFAGAGAHAHIADFLDEELSREPWDTRELYPGHFLTLARQLAAQLGPHLADREGSAIAATLIGTLQLARAVDNAEVSDHILTVGANAAHALAALAAAA
jgi:NAD(P)-dependent dehydrogenase (short-subunit alcohol dehydrogenase family)